MLDTLEMVHYAQFMNRLTIETRAKIVGMMVEGNRLRATSRMCDISINTVSKLLVDLGEAAMTYHDANVRNIRVRRLQADGIWSFIGCKQKNVKSERVIEGWGDVWTWVGLDADTKLCVSYLVGGRDARWAQDFMQDCADRIQSRVQVTTDGHRHISPPWKAHSAWMWTSPPCRRYTALLPMPSSAGTVPQNASGPT